MRQWKRSVGSFQDSAVSTNPWEGEEEQQEELVELVEVEWKL